MDANPPTTADYASDTAYRAKRDIDRLTERFNDMNSVVASAIDALQTQINVLRQRIDQIELRRNLGG